MEEEEKTCLGNIKRSLDRQVKTIGDDRRALMFLLYAREELNKRIDKLVIDLIEKEGE